ncbi:MAG TPA: DUF3365 domain-containing protein [Steroidobacteraceae bacterium]|jgi:protein-histidine pros-kinase
MKLMVRLNIALIAGFLVMMLALGAVLSMLLQRHTEAEMVQEAGLMLDSAVATREYTSAEILPLLTEQLKTEFLPQSIPFYAATQDFLRLREKHPEYSYKEATLNPTNPRDRAMDWESDLIQHFRNDAHATELQGERDTPMGRVLYLARPIHMEKECLECHSQPDAAPKSLLAKYGPDHGFGWQPNEVVGAQVVSVPLANAARAAHRTFVLAMLCVGAACAALWLFVNLVVLRLVSRPLRHITAIADEVGMGNPHAHFAQQRIPELNALTRAFDRMRVSLEKAMKLLGG